MSMSLLYNMRTIGNHNVQAVSEYKKFFERLLKDAALKEHAQGILDIIAGRT